MNNKWNFGRIILAIVIALLFWSELIFSNLPSLADLATPMETLGWTANATRLYFIILSALDVIGGLAVIGYLVSSRGEATSAMATNTLNATTGALLIYGAYQFITAFRLPASLQAAYWGIGVVYVLMAIGLRALHQRR